MSTEEGLKAELDNEIKNLMSLTTVECVNHQQLLYKIRSAYCIAIQTAKIESALKQNAIISGAWIKRVLICFNIEVEPISAEWYRTDMNATDSIEFLGKGLYRDFVVLKVILKGEPDIVIDVVKTDGRVVHICDDVGYLANNPVDTAASTVAIASAASSCFLL